MYNIFDIDELVENILSFVQRSMIGPSLFVNKRFNKMIKVDDDYESVAKNGDLFSLNKITCSYKAVINIAKKYENIVMMEWIIKKKKEHIKDDFNAIGFTGNDSLFCGYRPYLFLNGIIDKLYMNMVDILKILNDDVVDLGDILENDICFKLLQKHETQILIHNTNKLVTIAYKINNKEFKHKILSTFNLRRNIFTRLYAVMGKCARTDTKYVKSCIEKYLNRHTLQNICEGLIDGNHYDIFVELTKNNEYMCYSHGHILNLIIDNNYKFFTYIVKNNLRISIKNGYRYANNMRDYMEVDTFDIVKTCIHYKRTNMLLFLINCITFSTDHYNRCIKLTDKLKFNDINEVIIKHKELFKDDYII